MCIVKNQSPPPTQAPKTVAEPDDPAVVKAQLDQRKRLAALRTGGTLMNGGAGVTAPINLGTKRLLGE